MSDSSEGEATDSVNHKLQLSCQDTDMYKTVFPGQQIIIDDGLLVCKIVAVYEHRVTVECLNDYTITNQIKMVMPRGKIDNQLISDEEMSTLLDIVSKFPEIEFISLPNVNEGADVRNIRNRLQHVDKEGRIKYLSKIQCWQGIKNFETILENSDGFKVDKEYLGQELKPEKVFIAQKYMTEKANLAEKLVITST